MKFESFTYYESWEKQQQHLSNILYLIHVRNVPDECC
jgi:hypothetical protein